MSAQEGDQGHLRDIIEGNQPGLPDRLRRLRDMQLGKGIVVYPDSESNETRQIGLILPLSLEQNRHLVILNNGTALVIEPESSSSIQTYENKFAASEEDLLLRNYSTASRVATLLRTMSNGYGNRLLLDSDRPRDKEAIMEAIDQAVLTAQKLKEQQEQARREVRQHLLHQIDELLKPPSEEPNGE